jgi:hypothetical protein
MSLYPTRSTLLSMALSLTAVAHAAVAGETAPAARAQPLPHLKLATVNGKARNTRPVVSINLPPHFQPICEVPPRPKGESR